MGWVHAAWARLLREQRGLSLVEELISLLLLAFAVGIVLVGIYTGTVGVKTRQAGVDASSLARSQLELVTDSGYSPDPTAIPYPAVAPATGYSVDLAVVYWTAPSGPFTSTVRDDGLQKVTVTVSGSEGQILQMESYIVDR